MNKMVDVKDILSQKKLAVVGVSRSGRKFGNAIYRELKKKGYQVFAVNPNAESVEGDRCYPDLKSLPGKVGGVVINVKPAQTEKVVREAVGAGITRLWLQQGSESAEAVEFCQQHNLTIVYKECILMFAEPVAWFHRLHRWVWKILGKLPN